MRIEPGSIVVGRNGEEYAVTSYVREGAFGKVFRLSRVRDEASFALKTIRAEGLGPEVTQSLLNEGRLATEIDDPHVIKVHYFHDGLEHLDRKLPPYMIMDFADDGSLHDLIERRSANGSQFSLNELVEMFLHLASGMKAVNEKLIHRDVRPANILIHQGALKIADFGLAKVVGAASRILTFKGKSHLMYMAPEVWEGDSDDTIQLDVYSMGIVFYELSTLRYPYDVGDTNKELPLAWCRAHQYSMPESPDKLNQTLPPWVAAMILKMLAKRPQDRYGSWEEVITGLQSDAKSSKTATATDIHELVQRVRAEEERRLKEQENVGEQREGLAKLKFKEITAAFEDIAGDFNAEASPGKLTVEASGGGMTAVLSGGIGQVLAYCHVATDMRLRGQEVLAWGVLTRDRLSSRPPGFNIVLVRVSEGDRYGNWVTLEHRRWIRNNKQSEPLAFEGEELKTRLDEIDEAGRIETSDRPFSRADIIRLLDSVTDGPKDV